MSTESFETKKKQKKKKIKCEHPECKKNINTMSFTCKCGKSFCITHKNPETHQCSFDFRCISDLEKTKLIEQKCCFEKIKLI